MPARLGGELGDPVREARYLATCGIGMHDAFLRRDQEIPCGPEPSAALRLPPAIASSTLRTKLRSCERRALLISVRRAIWRTALRAEVVLGMAMLVCGLPLAPGAF